MRKKPAITINSIPIKYFKYGAYHSICSEDDNGIFVFYFYLSDKWILKVTPKINSDFLNESTGLLVNGLQIITIRAIKCPLPTQDKAGNIYTRIEAEAEGMNGDNYSAKAELLPLSLSEYAEAMEAKILVKKDGETVERSLSFEEISNWNPNIRNIIKEFGIDRETESMTKLTQENAALRAKASLTLKEALAEFMKLDLAGVSTDTRARIKEAVSLYMQPEYHSLSKVAKKFNVTPKTVSGWLNTFTAKTGWPVIQYQKHISLRSQAEIQMTTGAKRIPKRLSSDM